MKNRLLIVDDEQSILSTLSKFFLLNDYDVKTTSSSVEALKILHENKINIALLDINMPEMDGISLLKNIKKRDFSIQVIMMTGYSTFNKTLNSLELGAVDYILKPFDNLDELLEVVDEAARRVFRWEKILSESVKRQNKEK